MVHLHLIKQQSDNLTNFTCFLYQGYCDVFYKCRAVDAEGPLARLKNLLFNKQTLLSVAQWITVSFLPV